VFGAGASTNLAAGRYVLEPGARVVFGAGVHADRTPGGLIVIAGRDARIEIGPGTWLRGETEPVRIVAFDGAELRLGPDSFLNGCHLSAKRSVVLGRRAWVGLGSRVFDSDQHDYDAEHPEVIAPVEIGDYAWVASDVTVLKGVRIGSHCIVGTRSLVTKDVPDHSLAFGIPAIVRGKVGDRSKTR
jgi:acetyltransferase-like isoleucine patch superfamily enzyme